MPFRNTAQYLGESIASLRAQTYANFELLLVDDASTDGSRGIAASAAASDSRIHLLVNSDNRGLAWSLNRALDSSSSKYVARMDADDVSLPFRFERQLAFLESHSDIDMVGGAIQIFGDKQKIQRYPERSDEIENILFFKTGMAHPLFFFKRESWMREGLRYDESYRVAQDHELLSRAAGRLRMANLPDVLLKYREHRGQESKTRREERLQNDTRLSVAYLMRRFPDCGDEDTRALTAILRSSSCPEAKEFMRVAEWLCRFYDRISNGTPSSSFVRHVVARKLFMFCRANSRHGPSAVRAFTRSAFARDTPYSRVGFARFLFLAILRWRP
jgi:glycosyltransferase involved in cell wall biosynthesis